MADKPPVWIGSTPTNYQQYLVPFLFADYAADLAARVDVPADGAVLELACGTGVVTKHLRALLPSTVRLVASDLNASMLEVASSVLKGVRGIEFEIADGTDLPFDNSIFDAVVCQFGVMFFPDKNRGFAESARVLKAGGRLVFNVWDSLEGNPLSKLIHETVVSLSPDDPATFLNRPHSYCDLTDIKSTLETAGFRGIDFFVRTKESRAKSAREAAMGMLAGGPLGTELEERGLAEKGLEAVEAALRSAYGDGAISAPMQAIAVVAHKPA